MIKTKIFKSFKPPDESLQSLAWVGDKIWVTGSKKKRIFSGTLDTSGYSTASNIPSPVKNPGGLAWTGSHFLTVDRNEKIVFKVDSESGLAQPVLHLKNLNFANAPATINIKGSQVTDIAWGHGNLWFTCKAGYSSNVFRVDLENEIVISHFQTRGPNPEGISFDVLENYIWLLDARNRELSQFVLSGEWTGEIADALVANPTGLALDDEHSFWTSDRETKQVYQIKRED